MSKLSVKVAKIINLIVLLYCNIYIRLLYQEVTQENIRPEQSHFQKNKTEKKVNLKKKGMCKCLQKSMCEATSSSVALGSQCETNGIFA